MNIAIITGASSGIGNEFAKQLDAIRHLDEVWLIARRRDRMEELAQSLKIPAKIISIDITNDIYLQQFSKMLRMENPAVRMLINCSGYGLLGPFMENSLDEQLGMLELNCLALTKITYYVVPYMKKNSHIIQLASCAAFMPQKNFAIYAATKAYVLSFSRALNEELRKKQIYVTAVCPGPVKTEFFDIAEKYGGNLAVKKLTMVSAPEVVKTALRDAAKRKTISVYSPLIKAFHVLSKILPTDLMLTVAGHFK